MTSMRERMARAAHKSLGHKQELEHCTSTYRHDIATIVDAILAEMETPSDGMLNAGLIAANDRLSQTSNYAINPTDFYQAMIRAIRDGK